MVLKVIFIGRTVGVICPFDVISGISAPPSRLVKDEYGNEIGMNMSNSEEVSQTVQHPPQNEFARILTSGGMGVLHVVVVCYIKKVGWTFSNHKCLKEERAGLVV
jgi:hypothetical protein